MKFLWLCLLVASISADRYTDLTQSFRCMVCDNQSIFDSNATLAQSMREVVAKKIGQGQSDEEIRTYMHSRYGDDILYQPPLTQRTLLLWFLPFLAIVVTIVTISARGLIVYLSCRRLTSRDKTCK